MTAVYSIIKAGFQHETCFLYYKKSKCLLRGRLLFFCAHYFYLFFFFPTLTNTCFALFRPASHDYSFVNGTRKVNVCFAAAYFSFVLIIFIYSFSFLHSRIRASHSFVLLRMTIRSLMAQEK